MAIAQMTHVIVDLQAHPPTVMRGIITIVVDHEVEVSVVAVTAEVRHRTLEVPMKNHLAMLDAVKNIEDRQAQAALVVDLMALRLAEVKVHRRRRTCPIRRRIRTWKMMSRKTQLSIVRTNGRCLLRN